MCRAISRPGEFWKSSKTPRKEDFGGQAIPSHPEGIEVKNLSFSYGDRALLHDISFTLVPRTASVLLGASEAEIRAASQKAGIYDEIMRMKQGFDTMLADNGSNLSGGQKQRLSIARAILKDTPVILFDEPTSALDKDNQTRFLNTLRELKKQKTLFVIAHKLEDLSMFDMVLEMKDGRCSRLA